MKRLDRRMKAIKHMRTLQAFQVKAIQLIMAFFLDVAAWSHIAEPEASYGSAAS